MLEIATRLLQNTMKHERRYNKPNYLQEYKRVTIIFLFPHLLVITLHDILTSLLVPAICDVMTRIKPAKSKS